ncbi:tetratricopeptide repeat protein [Mycolicibacterium fortuitum]|nr:tetratricopeptide repeat protein [Mycolicibacterium fortuitum]
MLRQAPKQWLHQAADYSRQRLRWGRHYVVAWFDPPQQRHRLRRRLMLATAPVAAVAAAIVTVLITVVSVENSAVNSFDAHDIEALRSDVETLRKFGIIDPGVIAFAEGDLAVLEGKLADAEGKFAEALEATSGDDSCPVRINLVLVRETLADTAVRNGRIKDAEDKYNSALTLAKEAPAGCFQDNADANEDRRALRADTPARLERKIANLHKPPPPKPGDTAVVTPAPPPTAPAPPGPPLPPGEQAPQLPQIPPSGQSGQQPGQPPGDPNQPPPPGENMPQPPPADPNLPPLPGENMPQAPPPPPADPNQPPSPGENMPQQPPPTPPPPGQQAPAEQGPAAGMRPGFGMPVPIASGKAASPDPAAPQPLTPVGADGLPVGGNHSSPDLKLNKEGGGGIGGGGSVSERLKKRLMDANAFGGERE